MFGAINALFSGFAFAVLIFAFLLQREELQLQREELGLQREELAATREEIKGQKEQAIAQNKTLAQQTFENTFFQLLRVHSENVASIDLRKSEATDRIISTGRDCFKQFYADFKNAWNNRGDLGAEDQLKEVQKAYSLFYQQREHDVSHYFRHLYHVVKFVDQSGIDDKQKYVNFVRAQLSSYELLLLFYNCLSNYGFEKFKPLIEKYVLLHTMSANDLVDREKHYALYHPTAYHRDSENARSTPW